MVASHPYIYINNHPIKYTSAMGLDMIPMGKPKPGFERRFEQIFRIHQGQEKQTIGFFDSLRGKKIMTDEELLEEWKDIQIPSYETLKAPIVGRDKEADDWAQQKYKETDGELSEPMFILELAGYYVIELAEELDGVPVYISMNHDRNVFRGQFLNDCVDLIGEDLVNEAWASKLAAETLDYGNRLMTAAEKIAGENGLQYLKTQREPPDADEETIESRLHITFSLAKWLIFYGKNGHGYEADY